MKIFALILGLLLSSIAAAAGGGASAAAAQGGSLLSFLQALPSGKYIVGATINPFTSSSPTNAWNATSLTCTGCPSAPTGATNMQSLTVFDGSGTNTGQNIVIVNVFVVPNGVFGTDTNLGSACTTYPSQTCTSFAAAPFDWLSVAEAANSIGEIVDVLGQFRNPAGNGNNPWANGSGGCSSTPHILCTGDTVNTTFVADMTLLATQLKQLNKAPFILSPFAELNLSSCSDISGTPQLPPLWYQINCTGNSTGNMAALAKLVLSTMVANGVTNFLYMLEPNNGVGNQSFGDPGAGFRDLVSLDQPALNATGTSWENDTTATSYMVGTGLPMGFGSFIPSSAVSNCTTTPANTINLATALNDGMVTNGSSPGYPNFKFYILWPQCSAFNQQVNATGAVTSPFLNLQNMPRFSTAGGVAGG
jgi:hypothetical protein